MDGVDVIAKLKRLKHNLDRLDEDDRMFVDEMMNRHESGQRLNVHQILQIVDMRVPGEEIAQAAPIWTQGTVSVIYVALQNVGCGADIPVNLDSLIERLVLSPKLADWAVPLITETIRPFDFAGPVEKSALKIPNRWSRIQ
jgi:hypothetical protein